MNICLTIYADKHIFLRMNLEPAGFLKLLADPTRLRCLLLLREQGELCVCELTFALRESQPKVSRHLATLREAGLVRDRRAGQWIYYRLPAALPDWAQAVLDGVAEGTADREPWHGDKARLAQMPNRPGAACCA